MTYSHETYYFNKCKGCRVRTQVTKDVPEVPEDQVGFCDECIEENKNL